MERREDMDKDIRYPYYMFQAGYGPGLQVQTQSRPAPLFGQTGFFLSSPPNLNAPLPPPDTGGLHFQPVGQNESPSVQQHAPSQGGSPQGKPTKKRGRPRKYGPDRITTPGFSSGSSVPRPVSGGGSESEYQPGAASETPKRGRGRPRGSGSWQKLASIGGLMLSSAGSGFKPHVLKVSAGEDIAAKVIAFSKKGSRTVCILSASGVVSMVSIHVAPAKHVTYQGHFEILSLAGTYVAGDDVNAHGGLSSLSICLSDSECHVFGGPIHGRLLAASNVQLIIASFSRNGSKAASKPEVRQPDAEADPKGEAAETEPIDEGDADQQMVCSSPIHIQNSNLTSVRPSSEQVSTSIPRDIDLTRAANI